MRVENDQFVEGSTWWPGQPQIIRDQFVDANGYYPARGRRIYNMFKPVPEPHGDPTQAQPWLDHVKKLWPDPRDHELFFNFAAHTVQRPEEKIHCGIVLSGKQGIGKDSALQPVRVAVGSWNTKDVEPDQLFGQFRPWLQTLMLVVNEAKPAQDDFSAISLYNTWKPWMASPPETLPVNDKHTKIRHIINLLRVVVTTNNYLDLYIPPDDRRMAVLHSTLEKGWHEAEGTPDYFRNLWGWLNGGGFGHVGAWLHARDLSGYDPKAEIVKSAGWTAVAQTWAEADDGIGFALEHLGRPEVLLASELIDPQFDMQDDVTAALKSPRRIGHRMQREGYAMLRAKDTERWFFKRGDAVVRTRYAFVRAAVAADEEGARRLVQARGDWYVAQLAARRSSRS